jgi:hypothetical protein
MQDFFHVCLAAGGGEWAPYCVDGDLFKQVF